MTRTPFRPHPRCPRPWPALALLLLLLLGACDSPMPRPEQPATPLAEAQRQERLHNYQQAADLYLITARKLPAAEGEPWRARAAEMAWLAGNLRQAQNIIDQIDLRRLDPVARARLKVLAARIARHRGDYARIVRLLDFPRADLPLSLQREILSLLDEAQRKTGRRQARVRLLMERYGHTRVTNDADRLWQELTRLGTQDISRWLGETRDPVERGWLELAYIAKTAIYSPQGLADAIARWRQDHPDHPADPIEVDKLQALQNTSPEQLGQVAVLLPTSGPLAAVAQVVLDGIMAARFRQPGGQAVTIQVYDTGAGEDVRALYRRAVADGAQFVLGPMDKARVDALAGAYLSTPVLTLNYGRKAGLHNPNLFQFALLPEDEAAQAAERIVADGWHRVGVLVPQGQWGQRVARAFRERLEGLGGEVVAMVRFKPRGKNYSNVIRRGFRTARQRNGVGAEAIFMAATPAEARLLKPLLKFHYLGGLPVYATSHVYTGYPDPEADRDLSGLRFTEIPWLLSPRGAVGPDQPSPPLPTELDKVARHHPRLFAFGYDAFNIAPRLRLLAVSRGEAYPGLTGRIFLDADNRLHRLLRWARFSHGRPVPLGDASPARAAVTP